MNRIRVQLQEGFDRDHDHSRIVETEQDEGISVKQVQIALDHLYHSTRDEASWYPMANKIARKEYGHAIEELSKRLKSIPPGGIDEVRNILRKEWKIIGNREIRLDIENLAGRNLCVIRSNQ